MFCPALVIAIVYRNIKGRDIEKEGCCRFNKQLLIKRTARRESMNDSAIVESPKITNIHALVEQQNERLASDVILQRLQGLDYTQYANWLGTEKRRPILVEMMKQLKPWPESLYDSLCKLSVNLYLIAEAGPLDTILEVLAMQWIADNGEKFPYMEGNFKICHIVLFSLLILNSDLHNDSFEFTFTREQFIDNTLYAARFEAKTQELDDDSLKDDFGKYYDTITEHPLPLCHSRNVTALSKSNKHIAESIPSTYARSRTSMSISRKTSLFSLRPGSSFLERTPTASTVMSANSEFSVIPRASQFYVHEPLDDKFERENDTLWTMDYEVNYKLRNKPRIQESKSLQGSSGHGSGIFKIFRKNNYVSQLHQRIENANKNMQTVRAIVRRGCLELHIPKSKMMLSHRVYSKSSKFSVLKLNLFGAFAEGNGEEVIDSKGSKRPKCFIVEFPADQYSKQLVFECDTAEQCKKYVDSINFWASRITPIPDSQFELVSNLEYGWSQRILNKFSQRHGNWKLDSNTKVYEWEPLYGVETVCTNLNANESGRLQMDSQLLHWKLFVSKLNDWINEHNNLKPVLIKVWDKSPNFELVMSNWNKKYLFLNNQYHKYNQYEQALNLGHEMILHTSSII